MPRVEIPEIFGTALIDLLVGALTIIALLWVLNSRNSGERGVAEIERTSAFVAIEQYGTSHIVSATMSQPGYWSCDLKQDAKNFKWVPKCSFDNTNVRANWSVPRPKTVLIKVSEKDGIVLDPPLKVEMRVIAASKGFRNGMHLQIEGLDDLSVKGVVEIEPCCDSIEPHYLRVFSLSPSGDIDRLLFWHAHGFLQEVLACNYGKPLNAALCSQSISSRVPPPWVARLRERLRGKKHVDVITLPLVVGGPAWNPGRIKKSVVAKCVKERGAHSLAVAFEPDGDVKVKPPVSLDAGNLDELVADFGNG